MSLFSKNEKMVTAVVPTYNRPDFLRKTLVSILNQTYKNIQVIVVSNGRSFKNRQVVRSFKNNSIEYYENIPNSGTPSAPRNLGITKSNGEYIAFCDDDDLWMPNKVEKQIEVFEKDHSVGIVYCKMLRFNDNEEWSVENENGEANFESLLFNSNVACSSIIIRKSLIVDYGSFLDNHLVGNSEDYEFLLRHLQHTKMTFVDEFLLKYWSGNNRLTNTATTKNIAFSLRNLLKVFNIFLITYRTSKVPAYKFFLPFCFRAFLVLKVMIYTLILKRFKEKIFTRKRSSKS